MPAQTERLRCKSMLPVQDEHHQHSPTCRCSPFNRMFSTCCKLRPGRLFLLHDRIAGRTYNMNNIGSGGNESGASHWGQCTMPTHLRNDARRLETQAQKHRQLRTCLHSAQTPTWVCMCSFQPVGLRRCPACSRSATHRLARLHSCLPRYASAGRPQHRAHCCNYRTPPGQEHRRRYHGQWHLRGGPGRLCHPQPYLHKHHGSQKHVLASDCAWSEVSLQSMQCRCR